MRVVRGDGDTVKFMNVGEGEPFYFERVLYLKLDSGWLNPSALTPAGVNLETGTIRQFSPETQVTPAKAEVVVHEVGRVACGFNPK
jgi:hypothetical protein